MAQERTVVIDGFAFHSRKEAQKAQKEAEGVAYLKERMEGQDPQKVLEFYHKMLDEDVFETPIGLSFEWEIREKLIDKDGMDPDIVRPVDVKKREIAPEAAPKKEESTANEKNEKKNPTLFVSFVLNIVLLVLVVGMFFLASSSDNINILNYENELVNKYENWQTQLEEKEARLEEREAALEKQGA